MIKKNIRYSGILFYDVPLLDGYFNLVITTNISILPLVFIIKTYFTDCIKYI